MLPNPALKETYDKIVWVYVYRDFSKSKDDRAAERISIRFGVSSWPQIFLVDPATMKVVAQTGRKVESFLAAVNATNIKPHRSLTAWEKVRAAEERARDFTARPTTARAQKLLDQDDIVVRTLALNHLAEKKPAVIAKRAVALLAVPNDPFRYVVLGVLKDSGTAQAAPALEALVANPAPSRNPNVLRSRAVQALARCGTANSVAVVAPWAQSGKYFNMLTGAAVDTLTAIAKRHKSARKSVDLALKTAYPPIPEQGEARAMRACVALARRIHKARGVKKPFPSEYTEKTRAALMR